MPLNYHSIFELDRPEIIRTLLVGEAPPPNGRSYFYVPVAKTMGIAMKARMGVMKNKLRD